MASTLFYGSKMVGSTSLQTSVAEQEILSSPVVSFSLMNDQDCNISINGSDYIFIRANYGINISYEDFIVNSVKIQQNGITFNWIATRR